VCREGAPPAVKDGCRFRGSLTVNKVAGNFHITAGKYVCLQMVLADKFLQLSEILLGDIAESYDANYCEMLP